jgi:hypothetical protein
VLGSEDKWKGNFVVNREIKWRGGFTTYNRNFDNNVVRAASE